MLGSIGPVSRLIIDDHDLSKKIVQIFHASRGTYGSPRVYQALKKQGVPIGKERLHSGISYCSPVEYEMISV